MSMDLYLWKAPVIDDADQARTLVDRYHAGEKAVFESSGDIAAMANELRGAFSDDPDDFASDDCPWASLPFEEDDRLLALNLRWSADNAVLDTIIALAKTYDLVVYDPQGPDVYRALDLQDAVEDDTPLGFGAYALAFGTALLGLLLIAGGWVLDVPVLGWLLVLVGLFVFGVGFTLVYAFVGVPRQERRERAAVQKASGEA